MDFSTFQKLLELLKLPGSGDVLVHDTCVLSCGCLASEEKFSIQSSRTCPECHKAEVQILKSVLPLRQLYHILSVHSSAFGSGINHVPEMNVNKMPTIAPDNSSAKSSRRPSKTSLKHPALPPELDLLGLFCKYAKEQQKEKLKTSVELRSNASIVRTLEPEAIPSVSSKEITTLQNTLEPSGATAKTRTQDRELKLFSGLEANAERNFSLCFPFHRKVSSYATQQGKLLFSSRSLIKKITRFTNTAIFTYFDHDLKCEVTHFVLVSDKKWELYRYTNGKPTHLACGRLTGEYGKDQSSLKNPANPGVVVHNDFADKKPEHSKNASRNDFAHRLKSWDQLLCCLSEKLLVILGTKGIMRVLNVDPSRGEIGQPVYTYIIDFPIRCIALAPNNELIACGITTKEKMTGKQQPFIILHHIQGPQKTQIKSLDTILVTPITITVPYRDPLKIINFNASSTHILCCTVYEMRYFIISLRGDQRMDYKRPRLIFSDTRLARRKGDERIDGIDRLLESEDDDQMLDNEGITDIKFGHPFTNTIVVTSSSLKNKPSVVLKINGPALDSRKLLLHSLKEEEYHDTTPVHGYITSDDEESSVVTDVDILMKVHEIGSNVYGVEVSPRGDSLLFVDKLGRLILVAINNGYGNIKSLKQVGTAIVLLGDSTPALRYTESASVCFSSDGGKVMAVDRKGLFQVFDFTKGVPGEDPEVIKCKIISVR